MLQQDSVRLQNYFLGSCSFCVFCMQPIFHSSQYLAQIALHAFAKLALRTLARPVHDTRVRPSATNVLPEDVAGEENH